MAIVPFREPAKSILRLLKSLKIFFKHTLSLTLRKKPKLTKLQISLKAIYFKFFLTARLYISRSQKDVCCCQSSGCSSCCSCCCLSTLLTREGSESILEISTITMTNLHSIVQTFQKTLITFSTQQRQNLSLHSTRIYRFIVLESIASQKRIYRLIVIEYNVLQGKNLSLFGD